MPKQERAFVTRAAIIEAAATTFTEMSYTDARLSHVIDRTAVGKGALYFHFPSKHELARAVLLEGRDQLTELAERVLDSDAEPRAVIASLMDETASLIAGTRVVSASLKLSVQSPLEFPEDRIDPGEPWGRSIRPVLDRANAGHLEAILIATLIGEIQICTARGDVAALTERVNAATRTLLAGD